MSIIKLYKRLEEYVNTPTITNLEPYWQHVEYINDLYSEFSHLSLEQLFEIHQVLAQKAKEGEELKLSEIYCGFALIKILAKEFLNLEAYDVQLITGLILCEGRIAEMKTGEGKTLAALFSTYIKGLNGKGIHIHTFNDYLAERDFRQMKPIFDFLELDSSVILKEMSYEQTQLALQSDITYGSAKQFIYHYLRISLDRDLHELSEFRYNQAIIDEADAILLDEATNPFVIAGNVLDFEMDFYHVSQAVHLLIKEGFYEYSKYKRSVYFTEEGIHFLEKHLGIENLFQPEYQNLLSALNLSLHAHQLLERDVDYIVQDDKVLLVDEFTGRIVPDRKWRNGLQSAVEAKEGCTIRSEGSILNSISIPNFYNQYQFKSAMTATARESSSEINDTYGLELVVVPPNIPSQRVDHPSRVFKTEGKKYAAILSEIISQHQTGRPILVGTQHVSESEKIFSLLNEKGIECKILNAKNDKEEAGIIANAGMLGSIVISTNMAGRGTDIKLGGEERIERQRIEELGGLLVIGTNMHNSGRIDRQLSGRAGRQGEKGESKLFVSFEDDLFERYKLQKILSKKFRKTIEDEITDPGILKYLKHIQEVVEDQDNLLRTTLKKYAEIQWYQSQLIYQERLKIQNDPKIEKSLKDLLVLNLDYEWSKTITELFDVKDGIHFISLGGQNPLRAYRTIAHELFQRTKQDIELNKQKIIQAHIQGQKPVLDNLLRKRPSSTWTYTVSDSSFNMGLAGFLKDHSNLVFQIDIMGVIALFIKFIVKKLTPKTRVKSS